MSARFDWSQGVEPSPNRGELGAQERLTEEGALKVPDAEGRTREPDITERKARRGFLGPFLLLPIVEPLPGSLRATSKFLVPPLDGLN